VFIFTKVYDLNSPPPPGCGRKYRATSFGGKKYEKVEQKYWEFVKEKGRKRKDKGKIEVTKGN
jgi:hypothetical protein